MKLYIKETREIQEITLREWREQDGGTGQWSPDMFNDLEVNFSSGKGNFPGDNVIICTVADFHDLVSWWEDEVARAKSLPADWDPDTDPIGDHMLGPGEYVLSVTSAETLTDADVREIIGYTDFRGALDMFCLTLAECSRRFGIPYRTVQNWAASGAERRECALYIRLMMAECLGFIGPERDA